MVERCRVGSGGVGRRYPSLFTPNAVSLSAAATANEWKMIRATRWLVRAASSSGLRAPPEVIVITQVERRTNRLFLGDLLEEPQHDNAPLGSWGGDVVPAITRSTLAAARRQGQHTGEAWWFRWSTTSAENCGLGCAPFIINGTKRRAGGVSLGGL
jgi:hypothetical protein